MKGDYEFNILYDVVKDIETEQGIEYKIIKKNCKRKWYLKDTSMITDIRQIPSGIGKLYKNRCEVYNKTEGKWICIEGRYKELKEVLNIKRNKIGFYGSK